MDDGIVIIGGLSLKAVHWQTEPIGDDEIACAICNRRCKQISPQHCKMHGITVAQYKELFPNSPMSSPSVQAARSAASSGRVTSAETKAKIAKKAMGHKRNVGRAVSAEHRAKISAAKRGVERGEEFCAQQSARKKGSQPDQLKGLMSAEVASNISMARLANPTTHAILNSKESLAALLSTKAAPEIASSLGVAFGTVYNYIKSHGIELASQSSYEDAIAAFLTESGIAFRARDRKLIAPKELDFYLPDHNLGIEFNGLYWHSDAVVSNSYHREKWNRCQAAGIRLLMINEDEWTERSEVLKKKILNLCGLSDRGCGARKLNIRAISNKEGLDFVDQHHIQGSPAMCSKAYGAFTQADEMVAVVTLFQQRGTGHLDLNRFCTDGRVFPGAFSKILKVIRQDVKEPIVTFADLRYSDGGLYEKCGFVNEGEIRPDYRYIKGRFSYHKSLFTKARIAKKYGIDMTVLTEREAMEQLGYGRIYDCGKIRFRLP